MLNTAQLGELESNTIQKGQYMTSDAIIWGVVTGVLAGILLQMFARFIRTVIIPWYQGLVYRGVMIDGQWFTEVELYEGLSQEITYELKQNATEISGLATIHEIKENGERTDQKMFKLNGYIKDRIVGLHGKNINRKQLGQNVFLLEIEAGGTKMVGQKSWFSISKNKILCTEITLERRL